MKKYISILLSFMILMMSLPISASGEGALINGTLSIENYSAQSGETIDVEVILNDNPGITALSFDIEYDSDRLELIKAEDGKILGTSTALFGNDTTANPYRLCWDDLSTENNMGNGTVAILTFKVKDNAPSGIASVGLILNQGSTFNVDMEDVAFTTESGGINVTGSQAQETTTTQTTNATDTTTTTTTNDNTKESPTLSIKSTSAEFGETIDVEVILSDNPGIISLGFLVEYDPERLELVKAENGFVFKDSSAVFDNDININPYPLTWYNFSTENNTGNGTVATLTFKVKKDAPSGNAYIELIMDETNTYNSDLEDVVIETESVGINVIPNKQTATTTSTTKPIASSTQTSTTTTKTAAEPAITTTSPDISTTVKLGDVNTDGSVDALDASMVLSDYAMKATGHESSFNAEQSKAADLNSDGAVDALDASLILSYYAYKATGGNKSITEYLK